MFVDLRSAEDEHQIETDICIVGAGPAGLAIADAFADSRINICLVESGGLEPDADAQSLADGIMVSHPHHRLVTSRDRQFGGSTNSWGGACSPMSPSDFEPRPFLVLDGWPFTRSTLEPFYERAQRLFEIGPFNYEVPHWVGDEFQPLELNADLLETRLWQISPRTNFGRVFRDRMQRSTNVTAILQGTATEIFTNETASKAEAVEVRSPNGKRALIRSQIVVLACGAIDNARLLLLSRKHQPDGLGNGHDLVGRYFMQHPHIAAASVRFLGSKAWLKSYKDFKASGVWLRARIGLSRRGMTEHGALNPVASLVNRFITDTLTHTQSIGYVTLKRLILDLRRGQVTANFIHEARKILGDARGITRGFLRHLRDQNGAVYIMGEQYPNPESRVVLSSEKDRFGLEKAAVDWRLLPIDKQSIRVLVNVMREEFRRLEIAEIEPDEWLIADDETWPQSLAGGHHHMGTTRMGDDPRRSVVDADAKVHGVDNLYIAGSSIFPTVGSANPTLTLVATSLKLADHLASVLAMKQPQAVAM